MALALCGAPRGAIRGRGRSEERGKHRRGDKILSRASIGEGQETKRKGDGPATQANHYKLLVTVIIKRGGRNLTPITHGLVVITRLVG